MDFKQEGEVVWFSARKGYGFIKPSDAIDEKEIFVHFTGLEMEGYKQLNPGDKVEYALKDTEKGVIAVEVKVLEAAPKEPQS